MKGIYLLSGQGGTGINFLCSLISRDKNYGSLPFNGRPAHSETNEFAARFSKFQIYFKNNSTGETFPEINDDLRKELEEYTQTKNLILHTHYNGHDQINLKNLKKAQLYVDKHQSFFHYLLWLSKVCTKTHVLTEENKKDLLLSSKLRLINTNLKIGQVLSRLSINAYAEGMTEQELVINHYDHYKTVITKKQISDWDYFNISDFLFDTKRVVDRWQEYFDMADPIDIELVKDYNNKNLEVIEQTFGCKYEDLLKGKWDSAARKFADKFTTPILFNN